MRELSLNALIQMDGQKVIVKDIEYDAYDQVCTLKVEKTYVKFRKKLKEAPKKLVFSNEEFTFEYDIAEQECVNGEFKVYSLRD